MYGEINENISHTKSGDPARTARYRGEEEFSSVLENDFVFD